MTTSTHSKRLRFITSERKTCFASLNEVYTSQPLGKR